MRWRRRSHFAQLSFGRQPILPLHAFAILILATIWLSVASLIMDDRRQALSDGRGELLAAQRSLAAHAARSLQQAQALITSIDSLLLDAPQEAAAGSLLELGQLIERLHAAGEERFEALLFDSAGRRLRFPRHENEHFFTGDLEAVLALRGREFGAQHVAAPFELPGQRGRVIALSMRASPNRHGVAVIAVSMPVASFARRLSELFIATPAEAGILRNDGALLVHTPDPFGGRGEAGDLALLALAAGGEHEVLEHGGRDGETRLSAFATLPDYPLTVFVSFDKSNYLARWAGEARAKIGLGSMASLITIVFVSWITVLLREREREAEKLHEAYAAANAANRAKSDFLAHMSHELRTPLNAILGFSEMMREGYLGENAGGYRDYAAHIHASGSHLLNLVDQVLDLSRIEAGKANFEFRPVAVQDLADKVLTILTPMLKAKSIDFELALPPALKVWADQRALQQVLLNLLGNAVKFTPEAGRVSLAARAKDGVTELSVRDNGCGIAAADLPHVFDHFGRGNASLARSAGGFGLGLAITKGIVEAHGGRIAIDSVEHGGTIVTVGLPSLA